ncbi:Histone H1-like protein Hc1 [Marivirga sericea]|uniref:Histone H1-like protein Hc1 n=1 Tax=Marivirga sericea TaxID=1028 RepID=A0A1X7I803_9BACT|nr:histone H1 [Marivirga sericea]SMG10290.1 Histone H1-like protein Hc1 [Marivirga sericea]
MKRFEAIKELLLSLEEDFDKFYNKGNQAAGTRIRKGMQDLKNLAQEIRIEVQSRKEDDSNNTGPKKY